MKMLELDNVVAMPLTPLQRAEANGFIDGHRWMEDTEGAYEDYFNPPPHETCVGMIGSLIIPTARARCPACRYIVGFAEGMSK